MDRVKARLLEAFASGPETPVAAGKPSGGG
jgi:hypothetical protein